jgi:hypothetical protein
MDEKSLDELMRYRREAAASSLPPNFQQNVWRDIRQGAPPQESWFDSFSFWRWVLRPRFVAALLAIAMFVGIGLGSRQQDRNASSASQALNLEVFGATPPALPSTLLASNL